MTQAMDTDLFATKGTEYVLVIVFLVALVVFWRWLVSGSAASTVAAAGRVLRGWFGLREDYLYHPGHTWAHVNADGTVTVGLDEFSQRLLGTPSGVRLPARGAKLRQGEPGWTLEVRGHRFPIVSPVNGVVQERNEAVLADPALLNRAPYDDGWLMKVRADRGSTNVSHLLSGQVAAAWLEQSEAALRQRIAPEIGLVMQDGGLPVNGIALSASPETWHQLAREFLLCEE